MASLNYSTCNSNYGDDDDDGGNDAVVIFCTNF
jgi:hypothetical protein